MNKRMTAVALIASRMLASQVPNSDPSNRLERELRAPSDLLLGYLNGFCDALCQHHGLDDDEYLEVLLFVVQNFLDPSVSGELRTLMDRVLDGTGSHAIEHSRGMMLGGEEMTAWIRSGAAVKFVNDGTSNLARDAVAVIGGIAPSSLGRFLRALCLGQVPTHSCEYCDSTIEELAAVLGPAMPRGWSASPAVVTTYGCGAKIESSNIFIPFVGLAVVERVRDCDPLRGCCLAIRIPSFGAMDPLRPISSIEDAVLVAREAEEIIAKSQGLDSARVTESFKAAAPSTNDSKQPSGCALFLIPVFLGGLSALVTACA